MRTFTGRITPMDNIHTGEERWFRCPRCGKKLLRLTAESTMHHTPIYCSRCKREFCPTIEQGQILNTK